MNRPTAKFLAVAHYLYGGNEDAVGAAYSLVRANGFSGSVGRARRLAALARVAPELAGELDALGVDVHYVDAGDEPRGAYRAVVREVRQAEAALRSGGPVPPVCVALGVGPAADWPDGWRRGVWEVVNHYLLGEDRPVAPVPPGVPQGLVVR